MGDCFFFEGTQLSVKFSNFKRSTTYAKMPKSLSITAPSKNNMNNCGNTDLAYLYSLACIPSFLPIYGWLASVIWALP